MNESLVLPMNDPAIVEVRDRVRVIRDTALALVVDSDERKKAAADILARIAGVKRDAETRRVLLVKPHNDHVSAINKLFRDVLAPIIEADTTLRDRVIGFDREQRRLAAEAAAAAERERLASAALLKEAEKAEAAGQGQVAEQLLERAVESEASAKVAATQAIVPAATVRAASGSATVRKVWAFKVVDLEAVPRAYLVLDEARVRSAIAAGIREIPGLSIYQDEQLAVRR